MQHDIERIHSEDIMMRIRFVALRRTGAVVFLANQEIIEDLLAIDTACDARIFWQARSRRRDVVHSPVRKSCRRVIRGHDETGRACRGGGPRQLWRFVAAGAATERAAVRAVQDNVIDHAERQSCAVDKSSAAYLERAGRDNRSSAPLRRSEKRTRQQQESKTANSSFHRSVLPGFNSRRNFTPVL